MANSGGVYAPSANSSQLAAQASLSAASGAGFASSVPATATHSASGRPNNCVVPTFVSTFSSPIPSLAQSALPSTLNAAFPSRTIGPESFASLPVLHQPFVVGPGFSPVPAKLVSQIVAGKFVELHELLPSNIVSSEPEPQLLFDGRLVLTSPLKKPKRRIDDIATWLEAFSIFCLILVSHFPHPWKDLLQYQLLILQTYRQFSGRVWLSYDRTFRENAAATNLTDWSQLNSTLFSFHSAGWFALSTRDLSDGPTEPHGAASSQIICKSWNQGHCVAPSASCRFAHKCASCHGPPKSSSLPKKNKPSAAQHPSVAGPFSAPPFPNLHVSSFGVIPKRGQPGKWCLIVDLSSPGGASVNDGIDLDEFTLHYIKLDQVIRVVSKLGVGALMAKFDVEAAYRNMPVHQSHRVLLGMKWRDQFYVDLVLPFGLCSAPFIFNSIADMVEWILVNSYKIPHLLHYLDDFITAGHC